MSSAKKTLALLSTSALAAGAAKGAVFYTPVNLSISGHGALPLDLNQDGAPDFLLGFNNGLDPSFKPYIVPTTGAPTSSEVLSDPSNQGLPVTPAGTMIDGSYESWQSIGYFYEDSSVATRGSWTNSGAIEGYVGLELSDGFGTHYGWAHVMYDQTNKAPVNADNGLLRVLDVAMEGTPDTGILAGQTAETGDIPSVAAAPASQTNYLGGTASLMVAATGFPAPTFQWRAGAVGSGNYTNLPNGSGISDGTLNRLTLANLKLANAADYVVVVSNINGSVTSSPPARLTLVTPTDSPATLIHRYSFHDPANTTTFADSVGGPAWAGTLQGNALLTGTNLVLSGASGCYASLPANITSGYDQMSVEFWADIGSNPVWTRVFSFGAGGGTKTSGLDFSPYAFGGYQNFDLLNGVTNAYANNNKGLTNTTGVHVTLVVDSVNGLLGYYNGASVVSILNGPVPSLATASDITDSIGASLVSSDPYLKANIYEFRVYQGVLSPLAVALNDAVGPTNFIQLAANPAISTAKSGTNLLLGWPSSDFKFSVQSKTNLGTANSWTTLTNVAAFSGTNWQVKLPATGGSKFFRLVQ